MKLYDLNPKPHYLKTDSHSIVRYLDSFVQVKKFRWLRDNWII